MKKLYKALLGCTAVMLALAMPQGASAFGYDTFSYIPDGAQTCYTWGTGRTETYSVAIRIDDPSLVGRRLSVLEVQFLANGCEDCYVWISSQLRTRNDNGVKVNDPDYVSNYYGKPCCGTVSKILEDRFIIPEGGFYLGYTFTVAQIINWLDEEPVCVFQGRNDNGFFFQSTQSYPDWTSMSQRTGYVSAIRANIWEQEDGSVRVGLAPVASSYAKSGSKVQIQGTLLNPMRMDIKEVKYGYRVGDTPAEQHVPNGSGKLTLNSSDEEIPVTFTLDTPAGDWANTAMISLDWIDGGVSIAAEKVQKFPLYRCDELYPRNSIIEEYTGTWCGRCPRASAALEHLHADNEGLIALAYHNDDPMELSQSFPASVEQYPDTYVDRYYRTVSEYPALNDAYARHNGKETLAQITATAQWDEDQSAISCQANFLMGATLSGMDLRPVYILVADSLSGNSPEWFQRNYLSGQEDLLAEDSFTAPWVNGPELVTDAVYDNVVVYSPSYLGEKYDLPSSFSAGSTLTDDIEIDASKVVNSKGESLIQHRDRLRMVVLLVNAADSSVVNAVAVPVTGASGIQTIINENATQGQATYYDLNGRKCLPSQPGVYVKVLNGKTSKVVRR